MASVGGWGGLLRDLLRFPSRQFVIDTELSQDEVVERLRAIVEPGNAWLAGFRRTNKLFAGAVSPDGFKIIRLIYYRNSFLPVIIGRFEPGPGGVRVQVAMRPNQFARIFGTLWFGLLAFGIAFASFVTIFSSRKKEFGSLLVFDGLALAMGTFGYLMVSVSFGAEARKARGLLEEALQATPGPRIQRVLAGAPPRLPRVAGYLLMIAVMAMFFIAVIIAVPHLMVRSKPYRIAENYVRSNSVVQGELGPIRSVDLHLSGNSLSYAGPEGAARFALYAQGTRGTGVVLVTMKRELGVWQISTADFREPDGRSIKLQADPAAIIGAPNP
jgi:hypothetical protein